RDEDLKQPVIEHGVIGAEREGQIPDDQRRGDGDREERSHRDWTTWPVEPGQEIIVGPQPPTFAALGGLVRSANVSHVGRPGEPATSALLPERADASRSRPTKRDGMRLTFASCITMSPYRRHCRGQRRMKMRMSGGLTSPASIARRRRLRSI